MISVGITGLPDVRVELDAIPTRARSRLFHAIETLSIRLEAYVKSRKLNGQVLHARKHSLLSGSIHHTMTQTETTITGTVGAGKDVPYAAIHEFGGVTKPHLILPKIADVLAWPSSGAVRAQLHTAKFSARRKLLGDLSGSDFTFAKAVHHPGSRMPERSYLRSSLAENERTIQLEIQKAVAQATAEGGGPA